LIKRLVDNFMLLLLVKKLLMLESLLLSFRQVPILLATNLMTRNSLMVRTSTFLGIPSLPEIAEVSNLL
jgi:hypothetical protein